jgi:hypothetical protein
MDVCNIYSNNFENCTSSIVDQTTQFLFEFAHVIKSTIPHTTPTTLLMKPCKLKISIRNINQTFLPTSKKSLFTNISQHFLNNGANLTAHIIYIVNLIAQINFKIARDLILMLLGLYIILVATHPS